MTVAVRRNLSAFVSHLLVGSRHPPPISYFHSSKQIDCVIDSKEFLFAEDTLDSLLAEHIEGDALQAVRNRIADVQRGLRIQLEEVSNERDNLRIENETLRAQNATLTHILQQQSQKHISPVSQLQLQTAKAGSSSGAGLVSPVNSLLLLQLLQQQQQQQQQIQQQTQIANQLATMDCSLLGSLTSQLLATGSGVGSSVNPKAGQLPTAQQLQADPLQLRFS